MIGEVVEVHCKVDIFQQAGLRLSNLDGGKIENGLYTRSYKQIGHGLCMSGRGRDDAYFDILGFCRGLQVIDRFDSQRGGDLLSKLVRIRIKGGHKDVASFLEIFVPDKGPSQIAQTDDSQTPVTI